MKKILTLLTALLLTSCAPTAEFIRYDVYNNHPVIYNENGVKELPPDVLEVGESWVWYVGTVERTYRPRKKYEYKSGVLIKGKNGYEYTYSICGKVDIRNGSKCYHLRENIEGTIRHYLIVNTKRYML